MNTKLGSDKVAINPKSKIVKKIGQILSPSDCDYGREIVLKALKGECEAPSYIDKASSIDEARYNYNHVSEDDYERENRALMKWNNVCLEALKSTSKSPEKLKELYALTPPHSDSRTIVLDCWNQICLLQTKKVTNTKEAELAYGKTPEDSVSRIGLAKKWLTLVKTVSEARNLCLVIPITGSVYPLAIKKWDRLCIQELNDIPDGSDMIQFKSLYYKSPKEGEAQAAIIRRMYNIFTSAS